MEQAVKAYKSVVASKKFKEIERVRELTRLNEASALRHARQEGRAEGQRDFVKTMFRGGFSVAEIVRATGLSEQDVKNIIR